MSIKKEGYLFKPDADLASHKTYDVEVFETSMLEGKAYGVSFYTNEEGKLHHHYGFWGTEDDFDKANYAWVNDSTVSVRLYHSKTQKEAKFKVFGKGTMNGIDTD